MDRIPKKEKNVKPKDDMNATKPMEKFPDNVNPITGKYTYWKIWQLGFFIFKKISKK